MDIIKKYIDSYTLFSTDLELFKSLLSENFVGVLIRNERKIGVFNKEKFVDFLEKMHFSSVGELNIHMEGISDMGDDTYTSFLSLSTVHSGKDKNGIPKEGIVEDLQTYRVEGGKITFVIHHLTNRNTEGEIIYSETPNEFQWG